MSRQEKLDTNAKAIQQTELVAQLKKTDNNGNAKNARDNVQFMFLLMVLAKILRGTTKNFSRECNSFVKKMTDYEKVRVKLTNNQLKTRICSKHDTGTTFRIT